MKIFLALLFLITSVAHTANMTKEPSHLIENEEQLEKDIDAALDDLKKKSPQVHEDAIRIWKNFKAGKSDPHYTYRYWGRDIVLFLQNTKGYTFDDEMKVAQVFGILLKKNLINKDAAHVLTINVWSQLAYLQGRTDPHKDEKKEEEKPKLPLSQNVRSA